LNTIKNSAPFIQNSIVGNYKQLKKLPESIFFN